MTEEEKIKIAHEAIKEAHHQGCLQNLIGDALSKNAVIVILLDAAGAITVSADSRSGTNSVRDRSMIEQMTNLLADNMKPMMQKAGKKARGDL
jgi:hypothetical protein